MRDTLGLVSKGKDYMLTIQRMITKISLEGVEGCSVIREELHSSHKQVAVLSAIEVVNMPSDSIHELGCVLSVCEICSSCYLYHDSSVYRRPRSSQQPLAANI